MAIKWKHDDSYRMYLCTFTCYDWLWLYEIVNGYDLVYRRHLADDYTKYEHSSASFYEIGEVKRYEPFDFRLL